MKLVSCPVCDRQYDATSLAAGARLRCLCERVLSVPGANDMVVAVPKCGNCGGALQDDAAHCAWCGARFDAVAKEARTLCPKCFARLPESARHCHACGTAIRPQQLAPLPEGKRCPRCAGELSLRVFEHGSVVECSVCEGLWIERATFQAILRDAESRPRALFPGEKPVRASLVDTKVVYLACLTCGTMLSRQQFIFRHLSAGVVIDLCRLHGVWLDKGELEHVVEFIRRAAALPNQANPSSPPTLPFPREPRPGTPRPGAPAPFDRVDLLDWLTFLFSDSLLP